jgi:hypothetical protein
MRISTVTFDASLSEFDLPAQTGFVAVDCLTKTVQAATPKKSKKSPPVDIGSAGQ